MGANVRKISGDIEIRLQTNAMKYVFFRSLFFRFFTGGNGMDRGISGYCDVPVWVFSRAVWFNPLVVSSFDAFCVNHR